MNLTVSQDNSFNKSMEKVWHALTDEKTLSKWVLPNDIKLVIRHKFNFRLEQSV